jgi:hypothetical protein
LGTFYEIAAAIHPNHSIIGLVTPNSGKSFPEIQGRKYFGDFIKYFHEIKGSKKNQDNIVITSDDPKELINELFEALIYRENELKNNGDKYHPSQYRPLEEKIVNPLEKAIIRRGLVS